MILTFIAVASATAAAAALTWRLAAIAKRGGAASLLSIQNTGGTLLHICMLFTWLLFMREGLAVILEGAPSETMVGFGAMFGGLFAMCLAGTKKPAPAPAPAPASVKTGRG